MIVSTKDGVRHVETGFVVPRGAWDSHVHVMDHPADVVIRGQRRTLPHAPMTALEAMHRRLGIERAVIVEAPHVRLLDCLEHGQGRFSGIALIDDDTTDREIAVLAENGVRGCRFYFYDVLGEPTTPDVFRRTADRVAQYGWHVLLLIDSRNLLENERMLRETSVPIVIDHLAQMQIVQGLNQPAMELVLDLQRTRDTYVKVSSGDRRSRQGPPHYADDVPFGRRVIENDASRTLWGTDWPHVLYRDPANPGDPPPDELNLLDLFFRFCRSQADVDLILRDTPARLYG